MPRLNRRRRNHRTLSFDDLDICELMTISHGWNPNDIRRNGPAFPTLEALEQFYDDNQDLIETLITDRSDPDWHHGRNPGGFQWVSWKFRILPEVPRLQIQPGAPDAGLKPPTHGRCWETPDGFESSFEYMRRRNLLEDGEIEAIDRLHRHGVEITLKRHRLALPHMGPPIPPWQLASIARIFGESILSEQDLAEAEPFLND